jgi:hypothetical protein
LVTKFYNQRGIEGKTDEIWRSFRKRATALELSVRKRNDDLIKSFVKDIQKSYTQLTPGTIVIFNYLSLKNERKAYMAVVVGARGGTGVYNNRNKKTKETNTLMSCFLIDDATDLNTLAAVVDVLLDKKMDSLYKSYTPLTNSNEEDDLVRTKADISETGMAALFPKSEFRTFYINKGMGTLYKVNFNG